MRVLVIIILTLAAMFPAIQAQTPATFETAFRQGLQAVNAGDLATAKQKLEQASQLQPNDPRVWLALAQVYLRSNERPKADESAAKAAAITPTTGNVQRGLATFYSAAGEWQKAAVIEDQFAHANPENSEMVRRAAMSYIKAEQPQPAIEILRLGLEKGNSADLQILLAQAYLLARMPKEGVGAFQEALRLQPYEERLYFELARLQLRLQDFDGALDTVAKGTKVFDKSGQLELIRGIALYGQRKFPEAVDAFLRSAQLAPQMEQPLSFLGRILNLAHNRLAEATAVFEAFEKANPENPLGYYLHGIALTESMGPELDAALAAQAEALFRRALELKPDHGESQFELGVLLSKEQKYDEAQQHLAKAAELHPKSSKIHYHLSRVYQRLGKTEQAQAEQKLHEELTEKERQDMRTGASRGGESAFSDVVQ